ncbi:hypothetical protein KM043_006167 [Ampulex compressa]|nr:hypothetical protein KM043_006167 [Ampulex compressa]
MSHLRTLRWLWTCEKPPSKSRDAQEARSLYKEACEILKNEQDPEKVSRLIKKGLKLDPRFHPFYALIGALNIREGNWSQAIRGYENARSTATFDKKLTESRTKTIYVRELIESYAKRADWYRANDSLQEAAADYERVLALKLRGTSAINVQNRNEWRRGKTNDPELSSRVVTLLDLSAERQQDRLLDTLGRLKRYEAFRFYWNQFMAGADRKRTAALLTRHAEYKIRSREVTAARYMLFEALNLDAENVEAQGLLQVVYDTGHAMAAYTVIWCMHGCYDKALLTIEKGRDCDPYNPGYTLLKTIVLRASGRLAEAAAWLESVDKGFGKLLEPSRDAHGSIMGKLSIEETRVRLVKQWYLVRYDRALECAMNGGYEEACKIIEESKLERYFAEPYVILGDALLLRGKTELALEAYLRARETCREPSSSRRRKRIDLARRVVDILNDRAYMALRDGRSKDVIEISEKVLEILDEEDLVEARRLAPERGRALLLKARGHFRVSPRKVGEECRRSAAESLRFYRILDDGGSYRAFYGDTEMERAIDRFAPKRKLAGSRKILL